MASAIDATKPAGPIAYTADVRNNMTIAKSEITALQVAVAPGPFLPTKGGTLSGPLTLSGNATLDLHAVPLQQLYTAPLPYLPLATGGTVNGATTFTQSVFVDNGLSVQTGDLSAGYGGPGPVYARLNTAAGSYRAYNFYSLNHPVWDIAVSGAEPADGSSAGADLSFRRFDDTGTEMFPALTISRATGLVTIAGDPANDFGIATKNYVDHHAPYLPLAGGTVAGNLTVGTPGQFNPQLTLGGTGSSYCWLGIDGAAASTRSFRFLSDGHLRWSFDLINGPEPGDGSGCDLGFVNYDDNGGFVNTPLVFDRKTGLGRVLADPTIPTGIATKNYADTHLATLRDELDALRARVAKLEAPGV